MRSLVSDDNQDPQDPMDALDKALIGFIQAIAYVGSAAIIGAMVGLSLGCGVHVDADPIEVVHRLGLNPRAIEDYFVGKCATEPDPELCKDQKVTEFYAAFGAGMRE